MIITTPTQVIQINEPEEVVYIGAIQPTGNMILYDDIYLPEFDFKMTLTFTTLSVVGNYEELLEIKKIISDYVNG